MRTWADLPEGWTMWSEEPDGRAVVVYRPDVFDGSELPQRCLPTLYLTRGSADRRRPPGETTPTDEWNVTLFLEPEVAFEERPVHPDRAAAVDAAVSLAVKFDAGALDPRAPYQLPREPYLERLEGLIGDS